MESQSLSMSNQIWKSQREQIIDHISKKDYLMKSLLTIQTILSTKKTKNMNLVE